MTYHQADNLLDQRRAGAEMPEAVVNLALELTGDLDEPFDIAKELRAIAKLNREQS